LKREKSIKRNFAYSFIQTLAFSLFPLITFPYSSRVLGPEGTGKVVFTQSIVFYFVLLAGLGIGSYGVREAAKIRDNRRLLSVFVQEVWRINLASTVASYLLFLVALALIPYFSEYGRLLLVCSASIMFGMIGVEWLYGALEEYRYIAIRSVSIQAVSIVLLFLFVKSSNDYLTYAAIGVISNGGSNILNFINSRKIIDWNCRGNLAYVRHLKPIFVLFSMNVAINLYATLDTTLVGFIAGDRAVGLYSAATKINKMVIPLITSLNLVLLPRLSYYSEKNESASFDMLIKKAINVVLMLSLPIASGLFLLSDSIVILFSGSAYTDAVPAMRILTPIIVAIALSNLFGMQLFMPLRKERLMLYSVICGAVSDVVLNLILIPHYGATGAAIATLVAESVVTIMLMYFARKYAKLSELFSELWQYAIATAVMCVTVSFVSSIVVGVLEKVAVGVSLGMIIYGSLLLMLKNKLIMSVMGTLGRGRK